VGILTIVENDLSGEVKYIQLYQIDSEFHANFYAVLPSSQVLFFFFVVVVVSFCFCFEGRRFRGAHCQHRSSL
jgi:hypothetical protein